MQTRDEVERVEHFQGDGNPSLEDRMCLNCRRLWGEHGPGEACRPLTIPYPPFCRHPAKCAGLSSCPRDPNCCD